MIIHLGSTLLSTSSDLTRRLRAGRSTNVSLFDLAPRRVWLFSLQQLPKSSRSRYLAHSSGHSLCSTVPDITAEGRYPLRRHMESGLSSLSQRQKAYSGAIIRKTVAFSNTIQHIEQEGFKNRFFILL